MEILIVWAIFGVIIASNVRKAKKMQKERVKEHQENMQQVQNVNSGKGSLSHGVNMEARTANQGQSQPYKVNTFKGNEKMSAGEVEDLKQQIRKRNNFQNDSAQAAQAPAAQYIAPPPAADNAAPVMKTLDKAEFHSPVMQAGSTGTYSDMTGGQTFTQYDCGHEYNDSIVPQSTVPDKSILDDMKFDRNEMRKAFVMQEILKRKVI